MPSNDNPDLPSLVIPPRRQTPAKTAEAVAPPPEPAPLLAANAALLSAKASAKRAAMKASLDPSSRKALQAEADELEGHAARLRDPATFRMPELHLGRGGEVSTLPDNNMPSSILVVTETVQAAPDTLAAEATMERLTLAHGAGVLSLAVQTAESASAGNAIEQMLTHEIAGAHSLAMRLTAAANLELSIHQHNRLGGEPRNALADAVRCAKAAARLVDTISRAALTLDRLQNGGRQHVTVQHIRVGDGGQAVVAGTMSPAGGKALSGRSRREKRGGG